MPKENVFAKPVFEIKLRKCLDTSLDSLVFLMINKN